MAVANASPSLDRLVMVGAAVFGAVVGAWIGRAVFKWILDFEGTALIAAVAAVALASAVICAASTTRVS
jgi:hypothetical protein